MFLQEPAAYAVHLVNGFHHVHRHADSAGLVSDRTGNGLADPPGGIGREFVPLGIVKFIHCLQKTDIAFLNEVKEWHTAAGILLGNGYHQTEIGIGHFLLGSPCRFLFLRGGVLFLALLNNFCQVHFLLCTEQGIGATFTEIKPYRIADAAGSSIIRLFRICRFGRGPVLILLQTVLFVLQNHFFGEIIVISAEIGLIRFSRIFIFIINEVNVVFMKKIKNPI